MIDISLRTIALLGLATLATGCVAEGVLDSENAGAQQVQPRTAVYRCGDDGDLTVNRVAGGVRVLDTDGEEVFLPPAPPNQTTRYGADGYALVVEGRDALWMKARSVPLDCGST